MYIRHLEVESKISQLLEYVHCTSTFDVLANNVSAEYLLHGESVPVTLFQELRRFGLSKHIWEDGAGGSVLAGSGGQSPSHNPDESTGGHNGLVKVRQVQLRSKPFLRADAPIFHGLLKPKVRTRSGVYATGT